MIKIVMIDDHEVLREGLASVFTREPGLDVIGQAGNAEDGLELVNNLNPDVVTLDLGLPGMSGREAAVQLLGKEAPPKVIILSSEVDSASVQSLVNLGVNGYVSKSAPASDIVRAVKMVSVGQNYFSPDAMTALLSRSSEKEYSLTLRQMEVLAAAATGLTTKEIAENLHVSPKTVEKYRGEIIARMEAKNLVEAINKARKLKMIE